MIGEAAQLAARPSPLDLVYERFLRAVALSCLIFGIVYWVRLLGLYDGPAWRFDLMPLHWQVAAIALAVLFPFAAVGLWLPSPWGPVVWFLCAAIELVMYGGFPELYGERPWLLGAHLAVGLTYGVLRFLLYWRSRRAET